MPIEPVTHLEKTMAGTVEPVTHLERVISEYGGGGGGGGSVTPASIVTATGQMTDEQAQQSLSNLGGAQESLKLTATPTAGPSGNTLVSGTWSGATWEEVAAAVLASRPIQIDVANIGKMTLLYNMGSATHASSNVFPYYVHGVLSNVFVELDGDWIYLRIINARVQTRDVSGSTPTIIPEANTIYNCGEVASLTISNPPATGAYSIAFTSGATATVTTFPASILGLEDFAAEANTIYEINVLDNRALVGSWAVSA